MTSRESWRSCAAMKIYPVHKMTVPTERAKFSYALRRGSRPPIFHPAKPGMLHSSRSASIRGAEKNC